MTYKTTGEKIKDYETAISEANRFLTKAKAALKEMKLHDPWQSKKRAAAKRASMDLSNALVIIRATESQEQS